MFPHSVNTPLPVLIIDKRGSLGSPLATFLSREHFVIFVSNAKVRNKHIVSIRYGNQIPKIPNNTFSHIIIVDPTDSIFSHFLPVLLQKAKMDNGRMLVIKNIYSLSQSCIDEYIKVCNSVKILLYGDMYSETQAFPNRLQTLFKEAKEEKKLHLFDSGLNLVYPVRLSQILISVEKFMYSEEPGFYCLFPKKGISEITIGRIIHAMTPDIQISLSTRKSPHTAYIPQESKEVITNSEALQTLENISILEIAVGDVKEDSDLNMERRSHTDVLHTVFYIFGLTLFFLCLLPSLFFLLGSLSLLSSVRQIEQGQFSSAVVESKTAAQSFSLVSTTVVPIGLLGNAIGLGTQVQNIQQQAKIAGESSRAIMDVSDGIFQFLGKQTEQNFGLAEMRFGTQQAEELIAENELTFLPDNTQQQLQIAVQGFSSVQDSLPNLFGLSKPETYLVLFQNSNELRPGGGFVGSYGILNIQSAAIKDFSIQDIYALDGQLQGHVSPPVPLQEYLGIQNWFLRDSNFSIDQNQNEATENYFYTLESGKTVDGVVLVDTFVLQKLLDLTGPISVPEYNQQITSQNFFQVFEDHSEKNFTPGSQQKKTFLSAFSAALQQHLADHPLSMKEFGEFFIEQVLGKHISFWANNQFINKNLQYTLADISQNEQGQSSGDFFGINEANVGLNKANHYIQRSMNHMVSIDGKGIITHTVTVTYTNTSTPQSSYGGDYKVFIRAIIPHNAILEEITINGKEQPISLTDSGNQPTYKGKTFLPTNALSVYPEETIGESSYGFFATVPMQTKIPISVTYTFPDSINSGQRKSEYRLFLLKQPGTDADSVVIHVQVTSPYTLQQKSFSGVVSPHTAVTQFDLETDRSLCLFVSQ